MDKPRGRNLRPGATTLAWQAATAQEGTGEAAPADRVALKGEVLTGLAGGTQAAVAVVGEAAHTGLVDLSRGGVVATTGEEGEAATGAAKRGGERKAVQD